MTEYTCSIDVCMGKETRLVHVNARPNTALAAT